MLEKIFFYSFILFKKKENHSWFYFSQESVLIASEKNLNK